MKAVASLVAVALLTACTAKDASPPPSFSHDDFKSVGWLAGTWRGSGGNYPSFFEEYAALDDTSIRMRSFKDSTLAVVTDSSLIVWSGGEIRNGSSRVVKLTGDTVRFEPADAKGYHYTWVRASDSSWSAILGPPGGNGVVYQMRRLRPRAAVRSR